MKNTKNKKLNNNIQVKTRQKQKDLNLNEEIKRIKKTLRKLQEYSFNTQTNSFQRKQLTQEQQEQIRELDLNSLIRFNSNHRTIIPIIEININEKLKTKKENLQTQDYIKEIEEYLEEKIQENDDNYNDDNITSNTYTILNYHNRTILNELRTLTEILNEVLTEDKTQRIKEIIKSRITAITMSFEGLNQEENEEVSNNINSSKRQSTNYTRHRINEVIQQIQRESNIVFLPQLNTE